MVATPEGRDDGAPGGISKKLRTAGRFESAPGDKVNFKNSIAMSSKAREIAKHLARKDGARPGRVVTKSGKGKLYRVQRILIKAAAAFCGEKLVKQIRHQQSPKIGDIWL